jgi:PAS domain S-box-containing protein
LQQVLESISRVFGFEDSRASGGALRDDRIFLSTLPPQARERRLALIVVAVSVAVFAIAAPFAKVQLARIEAFIPAYQAALALSDVITAVLLFGQFSILRSPGLRLLACAYLFTALMVIVHTLSFPGLFAPGGLLGAGPQTTAWIYMFWHGGFPLLVIGYARSAHGAAAGSAGGAILTSIVAVLAAVIFLTLLVTAWQAVLPPIMDGNRYTPLMIVVVSAVWVLSLAALVALWLRRPRSVLDLWLTVVMCAWLFDIALSAVLNAGRFDLGFYAGRIYGLMAASFVLLVLLLETRALHARLARSLEAERRAADRRAQDLQEINRALQLSEDELRFVNDALEQRVTQRTSQLHASEARYRQVIDLIQEAIWIHSDGKLAFVNPFAVHMFGARSADELVGRPIMGLIHPDDLPRAMERTQLLMEQKAVPSTEMKLLKLNGKPMICSLHATQFLREGKVHVLVAGRDITEQKEAAQQLHQAQKMESVGQLTGGVAHDFNNLLTVIIGNLELIADRAAAADRAGAQSALQAAERGAGLIRQMLAFSRRQLLLPEAIRLNEVVGGMEDMLRRTLGEDIEIVMKLAADSWTALADKGQVETTLLNLAINARDAMPGGGKLTIETGNAHLDADYAAQNAEVAPGDYAVLAVSDTGTGMSPEVLAHACEPFFTTKGEGKGTGLGLSMIYGFAKQSGGHLKIYSEVGHGTTMRLYLPRHGGGAATAAAAPAAAREQPRGGETILLVEDDELVRNFTASQLRGLGYRVVEASDGPAALRVLDGAAIDMIFTDVVMPGGMTGKQLADAAQQKRPGLKTLYTSGYTENTIVHRGKLDSGVHFLPKPFRRQDLALKVREVLDTAL